MKHVLMILILLGGFAVSDATAQANCNPANCKPADCKPCPPGCCILSCSTGNGVAIKNSGQQVEAAFASMIVEGVKSTQTDCKMSRKEMKACIASCKTAAAITTAAACTPTPTCQGKEGVHSTASAKPTPHKVGLQKS